MLRRHSTGNSGIIKQVTCVTANVIKETQPEYVNKLKIYVRGGRIMLKKKIIKKRNVGCLITINETGTTV